MNYPISFIIFYLISIILLSSCGENKSTDLSNTSDQELEQQQSRQDMQTPQSLSGKNIHQGANPHAKLSSEQHIAVAIQHAEQGRMQQALDILTRAIDANPNDASLIGARGGLLLSVDSIAAALADLEKAVSLAPNSAVLLVNRSQAYSKFNRLQEAMADLDKAVTLKPDFVPARFNRGVLFYAKAKYQQALADFDVCIQVEPETAGPYFNRAVTRDAMGDTVGALADMNKFMELSNNPEWNKVAQDTIVAWEKRQD